MNRLYALLYSLENVQYAASFRFSRVTPDYILLYTSKKRLKPPTGKAMEIKQDEICELTGMDESWLIDCGVSLLAERAASHKSEGLERLSSMVEKLESELEKQLEKEGGGT